VNPGILKRTIQLALVASITVIAAACPEPPPGSTTTTSSSSTTSSSVPGGPCDGYTPTGVALSTSSTSGTSTIVVSGNGTAGSTVEVYVTQGATTVASGGSTVVAAGGTWTLNLVLPGLAPGSYTVVASVNDDCNATAALTVNP
jgi:hypothetical protein